MRKRALTPATRPGYAYPLAGHEGKLRDLLGGPLQANPHRWFHFRPPFASGQMGFHVSRSPQVYRVSVYRQDVELNLATGRVGHQLWVSIINASDLDQANGIVDTQVEFAFRPPTAGKVEAVIQATCGACLHALNVDDEWGVSDSTTDQSNFLMMHVLHPNVSGPSFVKMSHFPWETDNSTHQTHEFLSKGADYFASLVSDGAVAANETVIIRVGTRSDDGAMTNDMSIDSKSTFLWTIKEVSVRIAP